MSSTATNKFPEGYPIPPFPPLSRISLSLFSGAVEDHKRGLNPPAITLSTHQSANLRYGTLLEFGYDALMTYQHLTVEHSDHISVVRFNRPDKANALSHAHLSEIEDVTLSFRDEPDVRAVIFTGNGKHFSSGADLSDNTQTVPAPLVQRRRTLRMGERTVEAILNMDQITIAAWNGAAMGGGACIATACDFRIGSKECFLQYPEIDIGLNLMWKSLPLIINLVGPARAKRLVIGGERASSEVLLDWGVLDELVEHQHLMERARAMAQHYASKPPIAAQMIKASANQIANALNHAIMHMDVDQNMLSANTDDRVEALNAYLNNGQPTFTGD